MVTYDVIVVGGGIVGASAALAAVTKGAKVALVDAGIPGRASDAGAGIVSPVPLHREEGRTDWMTVVTRCVDYYRELLPRVDELDPPGAGTTTFRIVGELIVARDIPEERAMLAAIRDRLSTEGGRKRHNLSEPPTEMEGSDVRRYWPELRTDVEGLFIKDVGRVDGRRLTSRLVKAAARLGSDRDARGSRLTVIPGWGVLDHGGTATRVQVGQEVLSAGAVILATGAWAASDLRAFAPAATVKPVRGQIVHLRLGHAHTGGRPVVQSPGAGYMLGFDDRVVVGATHEDVGFDAQVTAGGQHQVLQSALEMAPGLEDATLLETRVGLRPVSGDGLPLVGALTRGIHVVTGLGAWGLTLGPLLAELVALEALGDSLPEWVGFLSSTRGAPAAG